MMAPVGAIVKGIAVSFPLTNAGRFITLKVLDSAKE
jgi:hypothetical protein